MSRPVGWGLSRGDLPARKDAPVLYLVIAALVVVALCVALPVMLRSHAPDEVDRFHVARSLTTTWSSEPQPEFHVPAQGETADDD